MLRASPDIIHVTGTTTLGTADRQLRRPSSALEVALSSSNDSNATTTAPATASTQMTSAGILETVREQFGDSSETTTASQTRDGSLANQVLTVMIDNTSVVGMCRRQSAKCGAHRSPRCIPLMREIALLCAAFGVTIRALPISTDDNTMADLLSRARAPDVTPELLHATLREWSAREPDTTHWRPQPATHAFLVPLIERATLD